MSNIIRKFKVRQLLRAHTCIVRELRYQELTDIRSCLLVARANSASIADVHYMESKLPGLDLSILYWGKPADPIVESDRLVYLQNSNLSLNGRIKHPYFGKLMSRNYDLAVDLTFKDNDIIRFLLSQINAGFIVGAENSCKMADMLLPAEQDGSAFIDNLLEILKNLKTY